MYEPVRNSMIKEEKEKKMTPLHKKLVAGVVSGGVAMYVSSPFDLVKVRMQDFEKSKEYKGLMDCFKQIYKQHGFYKGFFEGVWPNVTRGAVMTTAELTAYDTTRQLVLHYTNMPDYSALYLVYGIAAGIAGSLVAQPVDMVKTRVMNYPEKYKNMMYWIKKTFKEGGPLSFYVGLWPFMVRTCIFNALMFLFYGYLRKFFGQRFDKDEN